MYIQIHNRNNKNKDLCMTVYLSWIAEEILWYKAVSLLSEHTKIAKGTLRFYRKQDLIIQYEDEKVEGG